jgi:hypothetical protein
MYECVHKQTVTVNTIPSTPTQAFQFYSEYATLHFTTEYSGVPSTPSDLHTPQHYSTLHYSNYSLEALCTMSEYYSHSISKKARSTKLRLVGFCGADDSVHPHFLGMISQAYPFVEFGVLFRPDKVRFELHCIPFHSIPLIQVRCRRIYHVCCAALLCSALLGPVHS